MLPITLQHHYSILMMKVTVCQINMRNILSDLMLKLVLLRILVLFLGI